MCSVVADSTEGSPVVGGLIALGLIAAVVVSLARDLPRHPNLPCRACRGTGRHYSTWNPNASGKCLVCGGRGTRRRRGSGAR